MVNKWQAFFLIVLTLPIMGHVVLLPLAIDLAGRDSWISAFFSFPIGVVFLFALYRLRLQYPKGSAHKAFKQLQGNVVTIISLFLFLVFFVFLTALSIASLIEMISVAFLPETPIWALVVSFLLLSMYGASKSIKGIALTAGILFFTVMFTGHSITFINFPERDLLDLLPLLENGWKPVFFGTILLSNVWIELLFLLVIPIKDIKEKRLFSVLSLGLIANVLMMLSTMSGAIMTFGLGQAESFIYPALEIVRIIDIDFIDRLDVYALILMTFGCYIRGSLFLKVSYMQVKNLISSNQNWINKTLFITLSTIIGFITYYMGYTRMRFEAALFVYAHSILLYPIPFILLFIAWMRKRRGYY